MASNASKIFQMTATINHSGTVHGGHYTSNTLNPLNGRWMHASDSYIQMIQKNKEKEYLIDSGIFMFMFEAC